MKRTMLAFLLVSSLAVLAITTSPSQAQTETANYEAATVRDVVAHIRSARREIYLLAPTMKQADVYNALLERVRAGVVLRLLIANERGYLNLERNLAPLRTVDARWIKERWPGGAAIMVDDRALVQGSVVSGVSAPTLTNIEVTRPELVPLIGNTIKQMFARARRIK
jgi:phosphatidylserine/phosphatidylglycerophosphate/cardiolipin synthase-like enzyme